MPEIVLSALSKSYHPSAPLSVDGLDLAVDDGELLCLLGPSGCGKTTTLRMVAGLEDVTSGRVSVGGAVWDDTATGTHLPANRRGVGLVFQSYALWPHLDVAANVGYPLRFTSLAKAAATTRVAETLERLGIADYRDRFPSALSGGQQQRVALARALVSRPELLLLDEPLSNLDARLRLDMRSELSRLHRSLSSTMILVTHDQWEAMTLATRIALLDRGKLVQLGTPTELYTAPRNRFVAEFIGNPPIQMIELTGGGGDGGLTGALRHWADRVVGSAASIGIRPEMVLLGDAAPAGAPLRIAPDSSLLVTARVREVVPTGGSWLTEVDVGGQTLTALSTRSPRAIAGETVVVELPAEGLHAFDAQGLRVVRA